MSLKDILRGEFIGLDAEVVESKNRSLRGIKGKIVDEHKNTFTIETNNKEKMILKNQVTLMVKIKQKAYKIKGELLVARPEARLKKSFKI